MGPPEYFKTDALLALIGGATLHLIVGIKIMWGNIAPYVTSFLRQFNPSVTYHMTLHVYTATFLGQALSMYHGGKLEKKIGPRKTALFGTLLISGGTFLASLCTRLIPLVICQGIVGLGIGTAYSAPIICCFKHFDSNKAIVTGIITTGTGAGPFLFNLVATSFVNHENWPVDPETGLFDPEESPVPNRVPQMFQLLALCFAVTGVVGASLLHDPLPEDEQKSLFTVGYDSVEEGEGVAMLSAPGASVVPSYSDLLKMKLPSFPNQQNSAKEPSLVKPGHQRYGSRTKFSTTHSMTTPEIIRDSLCWLVIASAICTGSLGFYVAASYKSFGQQTINDDHFLTVVGCIGCLSSGLSRTLWGVLADNLGTFNTLELVGYISPIVMVVYTFTSESKTAFGLLVCCLYALWGANYALFPPISAFLFGEKNMGTNYGFIFFVFGVTSTLCIDLCGYTSLSFKQLNLIFASMGFVGAALCSHLRYLTSEVKDEEVLKHHRATSSVGSIF